MKVASFTVHGTAEQSRRWKLAAEAEGHRSAGTWLAAAADAYLKVRARAGLPVALAWRLGAFSVRLEGGELTSVRGMVSEPLGYFEGTATGPSPYLGRHRYTLVFLPSSRVVATLRTARQARALASELAPVMIRGDPLPAPGAVVERHEREAK